MNRVIDRATGPVRDGTAQDITQVFHSNDNWALRFLSRVGKRIYESVVQSGRDFPYIRVSGSALYNQAA